jgi:hypothetical protein
MANRRVQGGGDPAQGPLRDEIETMPAGGAESFPDVPPANRAGVPASSGTDARDVDLDAFAERIGLRDPGDRRQHDDAEQPEPAGRADVVMRRTLATAGSVAHAVAHGLSIASRSLDRVGDRLDRR